MTYQIEDNIPIPPKRRGGEQDGSLLNAVRKMRVGQSIFIDDPHKTKRRCISSYGRMLGMKLTRRELDGGFRVWRIE